MAELGHRRLVRNTKYPRLSLRYLEWRYIQNLQPTLAYLRTRRPLADEARRVVDGINREGVAVTTAEALFPDRSLYEELVAAVNRVERDLESVITDARLAATNGGGYKSFILELLGDRPLLEPASIFVRFALQKLILEIASAYFGMYTRLRFYNVWRTLATEFPPRQSQLWHRDPEDNYVLKLFVYLSDVDEAAGPFCYAKGTHLKGGLTREPPYTREKGDAKRSSDLQLAEVVPPEGWLKAVGPKGTIIFADTRGYHKGGLARERERLLYTCMFTSQATKVPESFERPEQVSLPSDKQQAFALQG